VVAGDSTAGGVADQGADDRVGPEAAGDGVRVGVEAQGAMRGLHRLGLVARVVEVQLHPDRFALRPQRQHAGAMREPEAPRVGAVLDRLDPGDRAPGEEGDQVVGGELRRVWEGPKHRLGGEVGSGCGRLS
jgi:hypothetical protein